MKGEENRSIAAKQFQEKEVKAPANETTHGFASCLSPANRCIRTAFFIWKCYWKTGPNGVLKARGLATSRSINRDCRDSQMDGRRVYFCQGVSYVLSALILQEVAARQEESGFSGGQTNPQRGVSSCSSPTPLLRRFSSANPLMPLPKGKPKTRGQEDELQRQGSCFVFNCGKQLCQAVGFFPPCYIGGS